MTLTLGRDLHTRFIITEATPGGTIHNWRMADVTYRDGARRFAPMATVFVHPDEPDLFSTNGVAT